MLSPRLPAPHGARQASMPRRHWPRLGCPPCADAFLDCCWRGSIFTGCLDYQSLPDRRHPPSPLTAAVRRDLWGNSTPRNLRSID
jgi:hypothetical protein